MMLLAPAETQNFQHLVVTADTLAEQAKLLLKGPGWRFGHLTARMRRDRVLLETLLLDTNTGGGVILSAELPEGTRDYPSLTPSIPAAHWAERAVGDMFGLRAQGHPRWKSFLLHDSAWPLDLTPLNPASGATREPYSFLKVKGEGIHEIPVGPIHAGIIEPGHFRFSCLGELITNLEIRLGYQHRGIEKKLCEIPWQQAHFLAESVSSDTAAGNALAHAVAMEGLLGVTPPPRAAALRTIALELERLSNHIGDLGALSGDIGYSAGAALFPPLRGATLALCQLLTGTRRQRYYIIPGGVARDLDESRRTAFADGFATLAQRVRAHLPLVLENPGVIERMAGTGRLAPSLAKDFGVVGPAGRASGSRYDARSCYAHGMYPQCAPTATSYDTGDVLARAQVRADEIESSLNIIAALVDNLPDAPIAIALPDILPAEQVGIGIVEAWRGELLHWVTTDAAGRIARYAIKDPSFNNWTGLAIAVRGNLVADFPVCNKSFNLSYSGNDL
ncbi:MAG TPA: NADH-quinone oxidoreductase subunit C [Armatimonadota bacterium]|jgi:Ni,Fe-hydrogenase III large subunit/Ni,Fe-hydrogenase III component G